MDALIYTAMSGANQTLSAQRVHAHNLANVQTPGFQATLATAQSVAMTGNGFDSRHRPVLGHHGVDTTPGEHMATGRDLDVAMDGKGYLAVLTQDGEAYVRGGSLTLDEAGTLLHNGREVVGENGPIVLPPHVQLHIGPDGNVATVEAGGSERVSAGMLKLVSAAPGELIPVAGGLFATLEGAPLAADPEVRVRGAHLERSNVSAVASMIGSLEMSRTFDMQMRLFKSADDLADAGNRLLRA